MNSDKALEIIKNIWPCCRMRIGSGNCNAPSVRKLSWPSGESVFLCEMHKDDLLVTDYMMSIDTPPRY